MVCNSVSIVFWVKSGNIISSSKILEINNVTERDNGKYVCHGYGNSELLIPFKQHSILLVAGKDFSSPNISPWSSFPCS